MHEHVHIQQQMYSYKINTPPKQITKHYCKNGFLTYSHLLLYTK